MRDERFGAELADADLTGRGQRVTGRDDENKFVEIDDGGAELALLRVIGEDSEFGVVAKDVVGDVAAERAPDGDADHGVESAEFCEHGQQIKSGEFVGGDCQFTFLQLAQFDQSFLGVGAQIQQSFGVFLEDAAGVGEDSLAR